MLHHVYSFSPAKPFELELYRGQPKNALRFDRPGVVSLGCNIHDRMRGYIYVVDSDLFATGGGDGRVVFSDLASGDYTLRWWHPQLAGPGSQPLALSGDSYRRLELALRPAVQRPLSPLEKKFRANVATQ